jgi:predicted ATP-grasp superfamily ATP-dependent carboligase
MADGLKGVRVLLTDGFWRKTVAAVRGLGRAGIRVTVGESTYLAPALFSRYCHQRVLTPSPVLDPLSYVHFLEGFLTRFPHDVIIPMEEESLLLIAQHRERFEKRTALPFADYASLVFARDKLKIFEWASALGIPTPETYEIVNLEAGISIRPTLSYPVVVKPRVGSGSAGITYVTESDQLLPALKHIFDSGNKPIIQERIPPEGEGIGVSLLLDKNHRVCASFVHRRLREYPVTGGPSTLRESSRHQQALVNATRLLQSLQFVGVAMVEFKIDPRDKIAKLLEVNPRFWGSLALAIHAGVNFPLLMTLVALGYDVQPVTSYRLGCRARWLLPGDVLHFFHNPKRWQMEPSFFRFNEPDAVDDIIDSRDPLPVLGTLLSLFPYYLSKDFIHIRRRRQN